MLADIGEGIAECEILKWHVKEGDTISEFTPICEVQSDKATVEITSRYDGVVKKLHYKKGEMAKVGSPLVDIDTGKGGEGAAQPAAESKPSTPSPTPSPTPSRVETSTPSAPTVNFGKVLATPSVRYLAGKHNVDLRQVRGTGREGRIHKEDFLRFLDEQKSSVGAPGSIPTAPPPQRIATDTVVPLSGYSRVMVKTMTLANTVPHFGYNDEVVMDRLLSLRKELKKAAEAEGIKLSYMPIILKATSLALLRYPRLNAVFDEKENAMIYRASHNLGVAMDTPNGLVVPNIKDVQNKSIFEIARELNRLQGLAKEASLSRSDLTGGTFTLSNIGSIGGTYASPVLVVPEVAIGALGRIQRVPRFDENDNVTAVNIMNISWAADHRVIDGATMAHFSNLWKDYLENPSSMLGQTR